MCIIIYEVTFYKQVGRFCVHCLTLPIYKSMLTIQVYLSYKLQVIYCANKQLKKNKYSLEQNYYYQKAATCKAKL